MALNPVSEGQIYEIELDKTRSVSKSGQWTLSKIIHSNLTEYTHSGRLPWCFILIAVLKSWFGYI